MEKANQTVDWDDVYWDNMPRVYKYFYYQVNDTRLAEDLTATTFVKAWRARRHYDPSRSQVATWLMTIARNTAIDYFRQERLNLPLETIRLPITEQRPLEDDIERDEEHATLDKLLAQLAPRDRELMALKFGVGLTNRDIAQLLNLSESNVGTLIYRTVKWLRAAWEATSYE